MNSEKQTIPHGLQIMIVTVFFGATLFCLHSIAEVFTPIFLALTFVLTVRPIIRWLRKCGIPSWIASTFAFCLIAVVFGGVVWLTVWAFTPIPQTLINYSGSFERTLNSALSFLESQGIGTKELSVYLDQINFNSVISWLWSLLDSLRSVGGLLAIVIIALLFLIFDTSTIAARSSIIHRSHSHIAYALAGFEKRVRHYWIISTIFGLIVAVIDVFALGMLGVPLALTWGVWAFITNYIPNVGFLIGVIPPMIMGLVDSGWQTMVWVIAVYSVINVVIQTFIQPKFTGDVVGLSPSVTFISLVLWTAVVGWLGSLLAVPLTLFFKALLVDADPQTRWFDVFLVSESDAKRRDKAGMYESDPPEQALDVEFRYPSYSLAKIPFMHHGDADDDGEKGHSEKQHSENAGGETAAHGVTQSAGSGVQSLRDGEEQDEGQAQQGLGAAGECAQHSKDEKES